MEAMKTILVALQAWQKYQRRETAILFGFHVRPYPLRSFVPQLVDEKKNEQTALAGSEPAIISPGA
jgi:hypothetical protein